MSDEMVRTPLCIILTNPYATTQGNSSIHTFVNPTVNSLLNRSVDTHEIRTFKYFFTFQFRKYLLRIDYVWDILDIEANTHAMKEHDIDSFYGHFLVSMWDADYSAPRDVHSLKDRVVGQALRM